MKRIIVLTLTIVLVLSMTVTTSHGAISWISASGEKINTTTGYAQSTSVFTGKASYAKLRITALKKVKGKWVENDTTLKTIKKEGHIHHYFYFTPSKKSKTNKIKATVVEYQGGKKYSSKVYSKVF